MEFLDSEQAVATLKDYLDDDINKILNDLVSNNIKIIYLDYNHIDKDKFLNLLKVIKDKGNVYIKVPLKDFISYEIQADCDKIILKCQLSQYKKYYKNFKHLWFEIPYSGELMDIKRMDKIIIKVPDEMFSGDELLSFGKKKKIMLSEALLSSNTIKSHPCNAYLCSGKTCHSTKGNFPRQLAIGSDGNIFAYGLIDKDYRIGNIKNFSLSQIKEEWSKQEQYKNFINLNKTAYLKFVFNGLYSTLFWGNCLKKVYKNE